MPLIVVMEDDAGTRMLVASVLKKDGYEVLAAENGLLGLQMVRESRPDLIISDIQMPELDGLECTRRWRAKEQERGGAALHIVAMTANAMASDEAACRAAGMSGFLSKPIDVSRLRALLASIASETQSSVA